MKVYIFRKAALAALPKMYTFTGDISIIWHLDSYFEEHRYEAASEDLNLSNFEKRHYWIVDLIIEISYFLKTFTSKFRYVSYLNFDVNVWKYHFSPIVSHLNLRTFQQNSITENVTTIESMTHIIKYI